MRIAIFVGGFPLISETFILRQITGLIDLGHEVDIFAENRPPENAPIQPDVLKYDLLARTKYIDAPPEATYWEMPVYPLGGETWLPGAEEPIPNMLRILNAGEAFIRCYSVAPELTKETLDAREYGFQAESLSALYRLYALCSQSNTYDVVHAHFGPVGNNFRFAKALWDAPFVVSFHGYDFCTVPRKEGKNVYQRLFETADAVTVNSNYTRGRVEALGCATNKLKKLPEGLNVDDFSFRDRAGKLGEPVRVVTVGRLTEKKGIEYSIRAVAKVRERYPKLHYDIIGDGPLRSHLEELIDELGVGDIVVLHGARDTNYVREIMRDAQLFMLSSVTAESGDVEGQGLVLQEAQASGLPVLATDHNGFPESIVPNKSGFLVPERDSESLADRLMYLIEHPDLWTKMGLEGRKHVETNYDIRKLNRQLVQIYDEAILNH